MTVYPFIFKPIFKERIWGGQKLKEHFGKDLPASLKIGESWEIVDLPEDQSIVKNGPLAGTTISTLLKKFPKEITGNSDFKGPFGLMVKFLDAQQDLSVQVHPDSETCRRTGKGNPKTECWYIIDKTDDAVIYKGLEPGTTREQFENSIQSGDCDKFLKRIKVNRNECHFLPSGTAHAIGAGLLIAEIQQPSDTTYRVFDWNRIDSRTGKSRELHIKDALESIRFDDSSILEATTVGRLVDSTEFKVDKGHQSAGSQRLTANGKMQVIVTLNGEGIMIPRDPEIEKVEFQTGDTFLIPAVFNGVIKFTKETEYLIATL